MAAHRSAVGTYPLAAPPLVGCRHLVDHRGRPSTTAPTGAESQRATGCETRSKSAGRVGAFLALPAYHSTSRQVRLVGKDILEHAASIAAARQDDHAALMRAASRRLEALRRSEATVCRLAKAEATHLRMKRENQELRCALRRANASFWVLRAQLDANP